MSVYISFNCWQLRLPTSEKIVLLSLADQSNDDGECWPRIANLMERTGLSERGVRTNLRKLEDRGLIRAEFRRNKSTIYHLPTPVIHKGAPDAPPKVRGGARAAPRGAPAAPPEGHVVPPESVIESIRNPRARETRADRSAKPKFKFTARWFKDSVKIRECAAAHGIEPRAGESQLQFEQRVISTVAKR